jgi:uncharacterized protein
MAVETMAHVATRIGEHAKSHGLAEVRVVLHGGEPLLCGPKHLSALIFALQSGLRGTCELDLRIHTNGVQLSPRFLDLFRTYGVKVGISLDGDRPANDRHRRYRDGRSSFDKVIRAIELLRARCPELYSGLLCTIDVRNDPIAVYNALLAQNPPAIDFLLPHSTWDEPPFRTGDTDYADWLSVIFDQWFADGRPVPVRTFDSIVSTGRGGPALTESLGLEPSDLLVVETDGTFEQADSIKIAFDGAPATGMNVFHHSIDEVARHDAIVSRRRGLDGLSAACRSCPVVETCGGGLFAHRYRTGSGFDNPSVFCADLKKLITHVQRRTALPPHVVPDAVLRSIAGGQGTAQAATALAEGQRTIRRALIASVRNQAGPSPEWDVLCATDPAAVDEVLAHPFNRVWAVRTLRHIGRPDDGRLAAIACVAAARAGLDVRLHVATYDGYLYLPTIGRYEVPGREPAVVTVRDGEIEVEGASAVRSVRSLTAGGLTVALEDLDPFRDCHDRPVADRVPDEQAELWQATFSAAWDLLETDYPEYAPALRATLTTLVPLRGDGDHESSVARDAFGSVAVALPPDPQTLCLLLLQEFQRVKLGGVLDLLDLFDHSSSVSPDTEGRLFDSYARLAVADFWRRRSGYEADSATTAEIELLLASGSLTRRGREFVEEMRGTLASRSA